MAKSKSSKTNIMGSVRLAVRCVAERLESRRLLSGDPSTWEGVTVLPDGVLLVPDEVAAAHGVPPADAPPAEGEDGDTEGFFSTTPPVAESGVAWNDGGGAMATTSDSTGGPWINASAYCACGPALEQGPVNGYFIFSSSGCNPGSSGVAVSYSLCGTASSVTGVDYTGPLTARSVYVPNSSQAWVRYTPVDDALAEPTETLDVAITDHASYLVGTRTAQNSILDNEPTVSINARPPATAREGWGSKLTYTISRDVYIGQGELVVVYARGGTATPGADYPVLGGSATIPAGQPSVTIEVTPTDDPVMGEGPETLVLTLAGGSGFSLGTPTATGTIFDNDCPEPPLDQPLAADPDVGTGVVVEAINTNPRADRSGKTIDVLSLAQGTFLADYKRDFGKDYISGHQWGGTSPYGAKPTWGRGAGTATDVRCAGWNVRRTYISKGAVFSRADQLVISPAAAQFAHDNLRDLEQIQTLVAEFNTMAIDTENQHRANYQDLYAPIEAAGDGATLEAAEAAAKADQEAKVLSRQAAFDARKKVIDEEGHRERGANILNAIRHHLRPAI